MQYLAKWGTLYQVWVAVGFVLIFGGLLGLWLNRAWHDSNWHRDQQLAVKRIDRLIELVAEFAKDPESGLNVAQLGDIREQWQPIKAEFVRDYGFISWIRGGRKRYVQDDRKANAIWTLFTKRVRPLVKQLERHEGGPLEPKTINQILDVLTTNLDKMASKNLTLRDQRNKADQGELTQPA